MKRLLEQNGDSNNSQPSAKKLRLKGRNKKRPFEKRPEASQKLCASIAQERECKFGDKCMFLHDLKAFFNSKPKDIGPTCHLFEKYGKCPYSLSCRFARHHLSENLTNLVNMEVYEKQKEALNKRYLNNLDKDVQRLLWKKKYVFSKSQKFIDSEQKKDIKPSANFNDQSDVSSSDKSLDLHKEKQESKLTEVASEPPPQHIGCVTDEDVITLRPEEKKKVSVLLFWFIHSNFFLQ